MSQILTDSDNAGDMLQFWTNDVIKSTHHRVVSPPNAQTTDGGHFSARYSVAVSSELGPPPVLE